MFLHQKHQIFTLMHVRKTHTNQQINELCETESKCKRFALKHLIFHVGNGQSQNHVLFCFLPSILIIFMLTFVFRVCFHCSLNIQNLCSALESRPNSTVFTEVHVIDAVRRIPFHSLRQFNLITL